MSVSCVFLSGDVDPRHWQGEGAGASAEHVWEADGDRDETEGNHEPDPPLQQGQPQRHTVRALIRAAYEFIWNMNLWSYILDYG